MDVKDVWYKSRKKVDWEKWVKYFKLTQEILKKMDGLILEAGCGPGPWVHFVDTLDKSCIGVDFDVKTLTESRQYIPRELKSSSFSGGDVTDLPFKDEVFGGYISLGVIEHFDDETIKKTFSEAYRVLAPGGIAFFLIPNGRALWRRMLTTLKKTGWTPAEKFADVHERWDLSPEYLARTAESSGFFVADTGTADFWYNFYAPLKYVSGKDIYSIKNIFLKLDFLGSMFKGSGTSIYLVAAKGHTPLQVDHGFSLNDVVTP
jgi:SAM-dependent methyltransferase